MYALKADCYNTCSIMLTVACLLCWFVVQQKCKYAVQFSELADHRTHRQWQANPQAMTTQQRQIWAQTGLGMLPAI